MPTVLLILLFTEITAAVFVTLLLLLLCYYSCYITVATDNLCQGSLLSGAAELTIHLLRLIFILWLPLCLINKFGFYFPRRLLRSPILVGHQGGQAPSRVLPHVPVDKHSTSLRKTWEARRRQRGRGAQPVVVSAPVHPKAGCSHLTERRR